LRDFDLSNVIVIKEARESREDYKNLVFISFAEYSYVDLTIVYDAAAKLA